MKRHLTALALPGTSATAQDLSTTIPPEVAAVSPALQAYATDALHGTVWTADSLNTRDRALVTFAAMVTRGESAQLGAFTALALDTGITPAELSETITHLAFYSGWGNATGAAIAMAPVFAERGIAPDQLPGTNPDLLPLDEEAEAARQADVILLAVHWSQTTDVQQQALSLAGKTILSTVVPLNAANDTIVLPPTTSGLETLASQYPQAQWVGAFNTIPSKSFAPAPAKAPTPKPQVLYYGDDQQAKSIARQLIEDAGFDPLHAGGQGTARYAEPFAMVTAVLAYGQPGGPALTYRFTKL
ncbi:carboxymuconolactone decarboxylase family protein [Sagittula sp. S175]|uniref:carboxymuconolactone decarboxylase family protein n=1 Tax=Sagittula sp. S175 TaxID=3415129 RepID=UPI003C7DC4A9